jgi:hypothetical protein
MQRMLGFVAIAAVLAFGVAGATGVVSASTKITSGRTIVVHTKYTDFRDVDTPPAGNSLGDFSIANESLSMNGKVVGFGGGHCFTTNLNPYRQLCSFSYKLPAGQITAEGVAAINLNKNQTFRFAVTGGTGNYLNARGYEVLQQTGPNTTTSTFHLIP